MKTSGRFLIAIPIILFGTSSIAVASDNTGPKIGTIEWEEAETVCEAWPADVAAKDARAAGLSFVSYPAAAKPFGMRGYMNVDGKTHPLRQVAYANTNGTLSIYYRTLGDRHYDVYLTLSGFSANELNGKDLTGTLVASRFGLYSEVIIAGLCATAQN
jgi:hypothetical protein